jgi:aspartate beta-hydroxylase
MSGSSPGAVPTDALFQEAAGLHGQNRVVEAERLYHEVLARDPGHAGALCYLGLIRAQTGKLDEALALLTRAVQRDPNAAEAHNHLGAVLQRAARLDDAIRHHERALALAPGYAAARFNLAMALEAAGRGPAAIEAYQRLVAEHPDYADAHFNLGMMLRADGQATKAAQHLQRAAALDPNHAARVAQLLGQGTGAAPDAAAMQRMNNFIGSFLTNHDNPRMNIYPGLSVKKFYDAQSLPLARALEANYGAIRDEIVALAPGDFHEEAEGLVETEGWDVMVLYERGRKNAEMCAKCPTITSIIESHSTVRTLAGLMTVSKLEPGTHIKPHRGPTNVRIRCHLGIKIPAGDVTIRVDDQTRTWQEGRCLVFDDHLEHEVWNRTDETRIVLILDNWHPDLTPQEIALLEGLHRYADYQAVSLNRYWSANANARAKARKGYD